MIKQIELEKLRCIVEDVAIGNARDTVRLGREPADDDVEFWEVAFTTAKMILDAPSLYMD